jgi:hypothetical protein
VQRVLVCGGEGGHHFFVIFRIFCRRRKGVGFVVTTHTVWSLERERERERERENLRKRRVEGPDACWSKKDGRS